MPAVGAAPGEYHGEFFVRGNFGQRNGRSRSQPRPRKLALRVRPGLRSARRAFSGDQRLEAAGPLFDEVLESADGDLLPPSIRQSCSEFGQTRLVIIDSEDELDDRSHWSPRLRLHARFLEKLGIFLGILLGRYGKVIGQRQCAVEGGARTAFSCLDSVGGLARRPQPVGKTRILVERD